MGFFLSVTVGLRADTNGPVESAGELKKLSLEELFNVEVTSVSKTPEKLFETASAIQVITGDDIRRSGATSIPEALRLAPNLQVAQVNASQWAISARGFNNVLADKLLVMIDGRVVYTPLYAGVFWDVQDTLMEDIDRIEVISGPGGTLWGANAVNGVINIITKSAKETQGLYLEAGGGTEINGFGGLRYGGELATNVFYRVYAKSFTYGSTALTNGAPAGDGWWMSQGGARVDWEQSQDNLVTVQGDYYDGRPDANGHAPAGVSGENVLGRWSHTFDRDTDFQLQMYFDQTWRDFPNGLSEQLNTYDIDWQDRFAWGTRQNVIWGFDVRFMDDHEKNLPLFEFLPANRLLHLYSLFVQDEIALVPEKLSLTLGSKFERNDYTGWEFQPSGRLAWTPVTNQLIWGAVSRAVRTPSRIDRDFSLLVAPGVPLIAPGHFQSEDVLAYELGWRVQPHSRVTLSLASFYNDYNNLRTAEPGPPPLGLPITIENGLKGQTYGVELSGGYQVTDWWRLRGGYTFVKKHLVLKNSSNDLNGGTAESDDPENQFLLQSSMDLPGNLELDAVLRYVDTLPKPRVASYAELDLRLAWRVITNVEIAVVGQNLLDHSHPEFIPSSPSPREIQRGVYGKVSCWF